MTRPIVISESALPLVHLSFGSRNGALLDPVGKEGTSRLLTRLMRRSIRGMSSEELDEAFDSLGATLGSNTGRSISGFYGGCIARATSAFLDLVNRVLTEPGFSEREFERLKGETLAQWTESLDDDSSLVRRFFARALFTGHPYGRPTGGTPKTLAAITLDDLKAQYPRLFGRNSFRLALAGDISEQQSLTYCDEISARLPEGELQAQLLDDPPGPRGRHLTFVDKPERSQTQILIGCMGTHPQDADHTALFVGHTIFGGTFAARLSREVRGKRGWSYGAYSDLPFDRRRQGFSMWTFPQSSDAADCIRLQLQMLEELAANGVTARELSAAKKYLINSHAFSVDTASKRASAALDRFLYDLPDKYHAEYLDRIRAVTVDDVGDAISRRLSVNDLEITVLGTHALIGDGIASAIDGLSASDVIPFDTNE